MTIRSTHPQPDKRQSWQKKLYEIIFGYETKAGKAFDIVLLVIILLSVIVVMAESVENISSKYGSDLRIIEWIFTILFTLEYMGRIISSPRPLKYIFSFMGIIDLLSILPTYFSIFYDGAQTLLIIRLVRMIRVFRILKLSRFLIGASSLRKALWGSRYKISVFFGIVLIIVIVTGSLMYLIEGEESGFSNIPKSIYWAIVTVTTVGYGDIAPQTFIGQAFASLLMIIGYAIIAVPTGIITSELVQPIIKPETKICFKCKASIDNDEAVYCHQCGEKLT